MGQIDTLRKQLRAARADGKVTLDEVKQLEQTAKSGPAVKQAKAVMKQDYLAHKDAFEPAARSEMRRFLGIRTNLADPAGMKGDNVQYRWVSGGRLYQDGVGPADVVQGQAGDCYLLAVLNSMGRNHRDLLKSAIQPLGDGTYNVRFFQPDAQGAMQPVNVRVDGQVAFIGSQVQYAKSPTQTEIWVSVLEKAYARWKGGYEAIGHGGSPGQVMTDLTGRPSAFHWTAQQGDAPDAEYGRMKAARDAGQMVNVATPDSDTLPAGMVRNHAYAVIGYEEVDGVRQLVVRNPWGNTEPGTDGRNDGLFRVPADQVAQYFVGAWTA
jgi:hypothetical protein